jgi:hypothetical protein
MSVRRVTGFIAAAIATAVFLIPASASAQGVTIGIKGGLSNTNVKFEFTGEETLPAPEAVNGLILGGWVGRDFNPNFGMLVEFLYDQAGTKFGFTDFDGTRYEQKINVDYFQVPVVARTNVKAGNASVFHIFGGPVFSFKTRQSQKLTVNGVEVTDEEEEAPLKSNDMGITIGAGFDIKQFVIDARYTWGLMNINKDTGDGEPEVKTKQFAVMFGMELWKK